jgi:acylphosphatase
MTSAKEFITGLDAVQPTRSRLDVPPVKLTASPKNRSASDMDATARLSATIYRFVSELKQAKRYFISGNVQGVGYRYFTLRAAERLGLTGYARNLPDGRVEAYSVGTPDQLAKLQSALERGPWGASVSEVKGEHAAIDPDYESGFVIIY